MPHTPRSPAPARSPPAAAASSVTGSRGGDRHLNRTLHDILLTRWRTCQRTRAYITRRRAEGKTDPEIRRCLKRYIARELYRSLNTAIAT
jgi:transposase